MRPCLFAAGRAISKRPQSRLRRDWRPWTTFIHRRLNSNRPIGEASEPGRGDDFRR